jgi:hypothetical protein
MGDRQRNDKRTGHRGPPRPPEGYPGEIDQKNLNAVARLDRYAAAMNMTRAAFLRRYGSASRPARPSRNGKASTLDR